MATDNGGTWWFYTAEVQTQEALAALLRERGWPVHVGDWSGDVLVADCRALDLGRCEDIEHFCVENGIAYNRADEVTTQCRELRWWRPGAEDGRDTDTPIGRDSVLINEEDQPLLTIGELLGALRGHEAMAPDEIIPSLTKWAEGLIAPPLTAWGDR
ncbi:MAG: hypothetical protein GX131_06465 [candidate division WS1 bacterium]|nr:hypothetical protein [candidate division WS1 bacterium]